MPSAEVESPHMDNHCARRNILMSLTGSYCYCSVAKLCPTLQPPWTVAHQASLSMGFPRQECWSGLPFPSPGDLPDLGIELASLMSPVLVGGFFTTTTTWEWSIYSQSICRVPGMCQKLDEQKQTHGLSRWAASLAGRRQQKGTNKCTLLSAV